MASSVRLLERSAHDLQAGEHPECSLKVMKFGGTSVGSIERLRQVVGIASDAGEGHRTVLVVSAASGVTDRIVRALDLLSDDSDAGADLLVYLRRRYEAIAAELLSADTQSRYESAASVVLARLRATLRDVGEWGLTPALHDEVLGVGERLSAPLVALALVDAGRVAVPVEADALIRTDDTFGAATVDLEVTRRQVRDWHAGLDEHVIPVVTGFIGAAPDGRATTLGRGGSDYSAALLAAVLEADVLERWTDVDGLYTADPRTDPDAEPLAYLVLAEAQAWNHAGRLGMHRRALDPLVAAGVPVHVRSTAAPERPGTFIVPESIEALPKAVGY